MRSVEDVKMKYLKINIYFLLKYSSTINIAAGFSPENLTLPKILANSSSDLICDSTIGSRKTFVLISFVLLTLRKAAAKILSNQLPF